MRRGGACTPPSLPDMRSWLPLLACISLLVGCKTTQLRPTSPLAPWDERMTALAHTHAWQLDGRAAAALGHRRARAQHVSQRACAQWRSAEPHGGGAARSAAGVRAAARESAVLASRH